MKAKYINIIVLFFLFLFSVFVRWNDLQAPMGRHHEFITGHVLTVNSNFMDEGPQKLHFAPAWTFNTKADKYYSGTFPFADKNNVEYYVSYPPFCFIASYYFQLPFGGPSVTGIRIFSLLIHLICALLIFAIANLFFKKDIKQSFCFSAMIAYTIYLFAPGNLWFHGNVYFADTLIQLFVLLFIFVFLKYYRGEYSVKKATILFFIVVFLGLYTEWLMLFLAFFGGLVLLIKFRKNKKMLLPVFSIASAAVLSIGLTFYQYSLIAGVDKLIEAETSRLKIRTGMVEDAAEDGRSYFNNDSIVHINDHYRTNYGSVLRMVFFSVFILLLLLLNIERRRLFLERNKVLLVVLLILCLTILTHHFIFYNFTAIHDFSTLKSSILFALILALVFNEIILFVKEKEVLGRKSLLATVTLAFIALIYFSIDEYHKVNDGEKLAIEQLEIGEIVKANTTGDELVFSGMNISPMMLYYAQRRILYQPEAKNALKLIRDIKFEKLAFVKQEIEGTYLLIHMNSKGEVLKTERFNLR